MLTLFFYGSKDRLLLLAAIALVLTVLSVLFLDIKADYFHYLSTIAKRAMQGHLQHRDILDDLSPFFVYPYGLLQSLFSYSSVSSAMLAFGLLFYTSLVFNTAINRFTQFGSGNALPALVYFFVGLLLMKGLVLTPYMVAFQLQTLAGFRLLKALSKKGSGQDDYLVTGLWLGLSFVIHPFTFLLFIALCFTYLMFLDGKPKVLLRLAIGFLLPFFALSLFYFLVGGYQDLIQVFFLPHLQFSFTISHFETNSFASFKVAACALVFVLALLSVLNASFLHHQNLMNYSFLLWAIALLALVLLSKQKEDVLLYFALPLSFYFSCWALHQKPSIVQEFFFVCILALLVAKAWEYVPAKTGPQMAEKAIKGRLWVLAESYAHYENHLPATPYLNMEFFMPYLSKMDQHHVAAAMYGKLNQRPPETIVDEIGFMKKAHQHLPLFYNQYLSTNDTLYYRIITTN